MPGTNSLPIQIISAGAGSGKTYTLTGRLVDLLQSGMRAGGIVATTFTQKAAAELQDRVRVRLLEAGLTDAANGLGNALIGTVHSIGVRLLQRFAFEAGVSPLVEIIADGDEQRLFNESLAQVLTDERIEQMNDLAERLGLSKKGMGEPYDWRRLIRDMTDVARANNFSLEVLENSNAYSWHSFQRLLPEVQANDPLIWQNRLMSAIDQTTAALENNAADETKTTRDAIEELRQIQNQIKWRGYPYWHELVKIGKLKVAAKSRDLFEPLAELAGSHGNHPGFHADIKALIDLVFGIAIDALREYADYKKKRGLIDYTDMEALLSRLLRVPDVRATLKGEIELLLVDEFQDTSPMQLDIFLELSKLAKQSIWVGDPKQSIYGFRGAEPALMQAIIEATGGIRDENILKKSWRSRPELVHAANAIFTRAFPQLPHEQIALEAAMPEPGGAPPALMHWHFRSEIDDRKVPGQPWMENCIARQIRVLLERGIPVWNKKRDHSRPVQAGDIAVLCRSNADCNRMAEALSAAGLKAAIARSELLETIEAQLVLACLKYLVTPADHLSIAEVLVLSGHQTLEVFVNSRLEALSTDIPWHELHAGQGLLPQLQALRPQTAELSASEILNLLLDELDLRRTVAAMGAAVQRLDNVDKLRAYAIDYESACQRLHSAASLSGFLLWLNNLADTGADLQGSGESPDTVRVLTYHKSKGLEFPVTVCHNLDQPLRERVWGVNLEPERDTPDLDNILGNRRLRLWINPYADQLRNTALETALLASPEWALANKQALEEEARLLYVGLTRARDYLVFPTTVKGTRWLNRVFSGGNESATTLDPDSDETPFYWNGQVLRCSVEHIYQPRDFPEILPEEPATERAPAFLPAQQSQLRPYRIDPHTEGQALQCAGRPKPFSSPLTLNGPYSEPVGKAVYHFMSADRPQLPQTERLAMAKAQLLIYDVPEALQPGHLLLQSDALYACFEQHFQPERIFSALPLREFRNGRQVELTLDWMLENSGSVTGVLWGGFADGMKQWHTRWEERAVFAGWVKTLLGRAFPGKKVNLAVVWGVEGQLLHC